MSTPHFGGHKATPFRKGGKRRAKVVAAKSAAAKAKGADLSNGITIYSGAGRNDVSLAFDPSEKRDPNGKWSGAGRNDVSLAFNPSEKRDPNGKWSGDGRVIADGANLLLDALSRKQPKEHKLLAKAYARHLVKKARRGAADRASVH